MEIGQIGGFFAEIIDFVTLQVNEFIMLCQLFVIHIGNCAPVSTTIIEEPKFQEMY